MTSFEHSEWHKLSLSILLNILRYYPHSSLTFIHSCLRGVFSKLKVHPLSSKCGSPGKSPALTVSLIPGRMKQSTSRSPLSRDSQRETCCYFTLQLKKHTVVAGSLGAADLRIDFASCSLLSDIHKIHLEQWVFLLNSSTLTRRRSCWLDTFRSSLELHKMVPDALRSSE